MRLMPLSENLLGHADTTLTGKTAHEGHPVSNVTDTDIRKPCMLSGHSETSSGVADKIDFVQASTTYAATIGTASYINRAAMAVEVARAMNATAASGDFKCIWRQDDTNTHRFQITSGTTFTLPNSTGANAGAANWCTAVGGWNAQDKATATTHTADLAAISDPATQRIIWDLGSDKAIDSVVVINPIASAGLNCRAFMGAAADTETVVLRLSYDTEIMASYTTPQLYQHGGLFLDDARTEDYTHTGVGYVWAGLAYSPGRGWDWTSYSLGHATTGEDHETIGGHIAVSEMAAGEVWSFSLAGTWDAADGAALMAMLRTLGRGDLVLVAADPDNEPNRETRLCRVAEAPTLSRVDTQSRRGRWAASLSLAAVEVR